jgi:hypothetical protein
MVCAQSERLHRLTHDGLVLSRTVQNVLKDH